MCFFSYNMGAPAASQADPRLADALGGRIGRTHWVDALG
jgi:hypothetical protein